MKRTISISAALAVTGLFGVAYSADHLDSSAVVAEPTADINDVYSWVDGERVVLAMTVFPAAPATAEFSDQVNYVFHTASGATFGAAAAGGVNVICSFDAAQAISCWLGESTYVTGDASNPAGLVSGDGALRVFAGQRADPFFFNLEGFRRAVDTVKMAASGLMFDAAGCPQLDAATSAVLVGMLSQDSMGGPGQDFFANLNTLAIVVSVDKSRLTTNGAIVSVSGATYAK